MLPFSKQTQVFLIGGALLLTGAAIPFLLPAQVEVEKSVFVKAKPATVFAVLNNPSEWERWSIWSRNHDPSLSNFYQGPVSGVNSAVSWSGQEAGEGKVMITETEPEKLLTCNFYPEKNREMISHFKLEPVENGTRLTWRATGNFPAYAERISGFWLQKKLNRDLENSLKGLKKLFEPEVKKLSFRK